MAKVSSAMSGSEAESINGCMLQRDAAAFSLPSIESEGFADLVEGAALVRITTADGVLIFTRSLDLVGLGAYYNRSLIDF